MNDSKTRGRPSLAQHALECARTLIDEGAPISLETVAQAAGLTKPGLMYHFPSKIALMEALVDYVVAAQEIALLAWLDGSFEEASTTERYRALVRWSLGETHRRSDLAMFSDPKLADRLTNRWKDHFEKWYEIPPEVSTAQRARFIAARLLADGTWLAGTTDTFRPGVADKPHVLAVALSLVEEEGEIP